MEAAGQETIDRAARLLAGIDGGINKALDSAMARSTAHLRSASTKAIREKYAISATNIRAEQNVRVRYTRQNGVQAEVTFRGHKIPLYRYDGASPKQPTVNTGELVQAMIMGEWYTVHPSVAASGRQFKSSSPAQFEDAFVARMKSGHTGIFERTGGKTSDGSDEIRELMGSSVPQMLGSKEVEESLAKSTMDKFEERLDHEVMALMNGWR